MYIQIDVIFYYYYYNITFNVMGCCVSLVSSLFVEICFLMKNNIKKNIPLLKILVMEINTKFFIY